MNGAFRWPAAARGEHDRQRVAFTHPGSHGICGLARPGEGHCLVDGPHVAQGGQLVPLHLEPVAPKLLDGNEEPYGRHTQLGFQLDWAEQCAERDQHCADPGERQRDPHPVGAIGHQQAYAGSLADSCVQEARRQ